MDKIRHVFLFCFVFSNDILKLPMEQHENMISSLKPTLLPLQVSKKRDYPMGTQILSDFPWWASFQRGQRSGLCALSWPSGSPCLNTTVTWHYTTAMWHICRCIALSKYLSNPNVFVWEKSCQNVLNLQGQHEVAWGELQTGSIYLTGIFLPCFIQRMLQVTKLLSVLKKGIPIYDKYYVFIKTINGPVVQACSFWRKDWSLSLPNCFLLKVQCVKF